MHSRGLRSKAEPIDGQAYLQIKPEAVMGIDVTVEERGDHSQVQSTESVLPGILLKDLLDHEPVDVDQRAL